jgi:hypothetical protein
VKLLHCMNSVGAITSEFKPTTKFEKEMAQILQSKEMMEAHKNDGAKILELNKVCDALTMLHLFILNLTRYYNITDCYVFIH